MALSQEDQVPRKISLREAYAKIRIWYQGNVRLIQAREDDYGRRSVSLIRALPESPSELEIRAIFNEVISGVLEWAYHQSDGSYKMAAYAQGGLESAGVTRILSEQETVDLQKSGLWPFLTYSTLSRDVATSDAASVNESAQVEAIAGEKTVSQSSQVPYESLANVESETSQARDDIATRRPTRRKAGARKREGRRAPTAAIPPTPERAAFDTDQPAKHDNLSVQEQARTFAKLLVARDVGMPLSLGLFGNWGAGKTHFMDLIRSEIRNLTASQPPSNEGSAYLRRVAQIDFNAWNYVDANLWASLAVRLFDGLATEYAPNDNEREVEVIRRQLHAEVQSSERAKEEAAKLQEGAKHERQQATLDLASLQARRTHIARKYGARFWKRFLTLSPGADERVKRAKSLASRLGLGDALETAEDARRLYRDMRNLQGRWQVLLRSVATGVSTFGGSLMALGAITIMLVAAVAVGPLVAMVLGWIGVTGQTWQALLEWLGRGVVLAGPIIAWAGRQLEIVAKGTTELESLQADFAATDPAEGADQEEKDLRQNLEQLVGEIRTQEEKVKEAERRITRAQEELQRINAGGLLYDFALGRRAATEYSSNLGVVSVIREDFQRLRHLLEDWNKNYQGSQAPIERIILYIDDLDRCHPDQVVQVLQAVHLFLAFDLFAVVVAVDPRWLERSLYKAYAPDLEHETDRGAFRGASEFSPQNYLEKIFQIPFSLPPMRPDGYKKLMENVLAGRGDPTRSANTTPSTAGGLATPRQAPACRLIWGKGSVALKWAISQLPPHPESTPHRFSRSGRGNSRRSCIRSSRRRDWPSG